MGTGLAIGFLCGIIALVIGAVSLGVDAHRFNTNPINKALKRTASVEPRFTNMLFTLFLFTAMGAAIGYLLA